MQKKPFIPMLPSEIPEQQTYEIKPFPPRPIGYWGYCAFIDRMPATDQPKGSPRKTTHVATVEWCLSPWNSRWDCYHLQRRGRYWLMWNYRQEEDSWYAKWSWSLYGWSHARGIDLDTAAFFMLRDAWAAERDEYNLSRFFLIDDMGVLDVSDLHTIGRNLWPESYGLNKKDPM